MSEDIQRSLGRIEAKLDNALRSSRDHENRIRVLERWMWRLAGGTAVALILFKLM